MDENYSSRKTKKRATLVSQLLYASPAWWGYLKADDRNRLQSIIVKAIRYGYLPRSFSTIDELREDSDNKLFISARYNPNHVLHRLLTQPKTTEHNLRQRTHNLTLPMDVNASMKQNCVYIYNAVQRHLLTLLLCFILTRTFFHRHTHV